MVGVVRGVGKRGAVVLGEIPGQIGGIRRRIAGAATSSRIATEQGDSAHQMEAGIPVAIGLTAALVGVVGAGGNPDLIAADGNRERVLQPGKGIGPRHAAIGSAGGSIDIKGARSFQNDRVCVVNQLIGVREARHGGEGALHGGGGGDGVAGAGWGAQFGQVQRSVSHVQGAGDRKAVGCGPADFAGIGAIQSHSREGSQCANGVARGDASFGLDGDRPANPTGSRKDGIKVPLHGHRPRSSRRSGGVGSPHGAPVNRGSSGIGIRIA